MGKSEILRGLEGLPQNSLREVEEFINVLKKCKGKRQATDRSAEVLAKKQRSAIEKWAGSRIKGGFSGREHAAVLHVSNRCR
jgi:hypothetical protein